MAAIKAAKGGRAIFYSRLGLIVVLFAVGCCCWSAKVVSAQRDNDQDDFDDSGFDDSGYSSPQNHDAEGSNHNPSNYSPASEDLDEDDEVDESNQIANVVSQSPQQFYSPVNSIVLPLQMQPSRAKRSVEEAGDKPDGFNEGQHKAAGQQLRALVRKRRYSKGYIGPVYTYVKTDKHANYKWGVKHKVGKHYG